MLIALIVFVLSVASILGCYAAIVHLPGVLARRRMDKRLHEVAGPVVTEDGTSLVRRPSEGPVPAFDRLISQTGAGTSMRRLIDQSGVRTSPSAVLMMVAVAGIVAAVAALTFARWPYAPLVAAPAGAVLPLAWLGHRRSKRLAKFEELFPEALDLLSRAIRAGHAFQTAMGMVADEMREPVGPEFKRTFDQQNFGLPLREALAQLGERMPLLDVRFFVTAVLIQRDTGGNLSEILDNLAHVVRERFKIQRQIRVHTAHGRFTGWVLMGLPAALGVALSFINPEHMNLLFRERMGQTMLVVAIVMQTVGYVWIRRVIKIEV